MIKKRRRRRRTKASLISAISSPLDSAFAEKPSVHPSSASGRTEERLKSLEIFRSC
jgi:hypothetical protein